MPPIRRDSLRCRDADLYYEICGDGPPIIFAHGLGGNHLSWWQQVPFFSKNYTCVTFSHRGFWPSRETPERFGSSAFADDLTMLLDHLHLDDAIFVAQSMGGWTCLEFALRSPKRVRALVLASTTGGLDFQTLPESAREEIARWKEHSAKEKGVLAKEGILAATGGRMAKEQPALTYLYNSLNALLPSAYRESIRAKIHSERIIDAQRLSMVNVPTLFLTGTEDIVFPSPAASALAALMPFAQYACIEKAGHSGYFERAEVFNQVVEEYLRAVLPVPDRSA